MLTESRPGLAPSGSVSQAGPPLDVCLSVETGRQAQLGSVLSAYAWQGIFPKAPLLLVPEKHPGPPLGTRSDACPAPPFISLHRLLF